MGKDVGTLMQAQAQTEAALKRDKEVLEQRAPGDTLASMAVGGGSGGGGGGGQAPASGR